MDKLLPIVWYFILLGEFTLYIILDGSNLGVGILTLFTAKERRRSVMMDMLSPVWNANETWLLVAAGTLFGAFPSVFAVGLNALILPGFVILLGIIFRAVSFEFHAYAENKVFWSRLFGAGSIVLAAGHGMLVGGMLSGVRVVDGRFAGSMWDWATYITLLTTIGIISVYFLLAYARIRNMYGVYNAVLAVFIICVAVLAAYTYPYMIPGSFTIWNAASPPSTLRFMLWGIGPLLPFILAYNFYLTRIFRKTPVTYTL